MAAPVCLVGAVFVYGVTSPTNQSDVGQLWHYPLYTSHGLQSLYTTGTWLWVYLVVEIASRMINAKFNERIYKFVTESSLYAYLCHYFFITLVAVSVVRPLDLSFGAAVPISLTLTTLLIFGSYMIIELVRSLCWRDDSNDEAVQNS